MSDLDREKFDAYMRDWRGIKDPCPRCRGFGVRTYGSTSTWHGGIGGAAMTQGVCDGCWGSGDQNRPWVSLRRVEALERLRNAVVARADEITLRRMADEVGKRDI